MPALQALMAAHRAGALAHRCARAAAAILLISFTLSACVGSGAVPPTLALPAAYTHAALPSVTAAATTSAGAAQQFALGHDLPGQWWALLGSDELNILIQQAIASYPDIAAQQAALQAALEAVRAQQGVFLPQVQGRADASRQKLFGAAVLPGAPVFITNIYQADVDVSYNVDLFGAERHALQGLQAQAQAQRSRLRASVLTLTANVASTAIQIASLREQIDVTQQIIDLENRELTVIRRQFQLGSQTRADVLQQQSNIAAVRATLPPLEQQLSVAEHELAVLTGRFPHDAPAPALHLADLHLPGQLPVSLPSALVEQRPDIQEQQALVRQAAAQVGVATANLLPQLTLSGSFGAESLHLATLLKPVSNVWTIAAGLTQPIFEGGTLRARRRAAIDTFQQTAAQYRLTVLQAFQNVADTLTAIVHDAQTLDADQQALDASAASLDLIQRQYRIGAANYVALLTAQQAYQQARINEVRATASRYTDSVTLFQALGGGWWNRADPIALSDETGNLPVHAGATQSNGSTHGSQG